MQCCICSKWVYLRSFWRSCHSGPCLFWRSHTYQLCVILGLLQLVYLHCATWPPSSNAALLPHPRLQTSYPPFAHFVSSPSVPPPPPHVPGCFSIPSASSSPLTFSWPFNGMLEVFEPEALNYCTLSCLIQLTLFVSRDVTLLHRPLSRYLDSLLCDLITPTLGLAFSLLIAAALSFSSHRAYPTLNFLPPLFLCLTPTQMM